MATRPTEYHTEPDLELEFTGSLHVEKNAAGQPILVCGDKRVAEIIARGLSIWSGGNREGKLEVKFHAKTVTMIVADDGFDGAFNEESEPHPGT